MRHSQLDRPALTDDSSGVSAEDPRGNQKVQIYIRAFDTRNTSEGGDMLVSVVIFTPSSDHRRGAKPDCLQPFPTCPFCPLWHRPFGAFYCGERKQHQRISFLENY